MFQKLRNERRPILCKNVARHPRTKGKWRQDLRIWLMWGRGAGLLNIFCNENWFDWLGKLLEEKPIPYDLVCPSVGWFGRSVCHSFVIIVDCPSNLKSDIFHKLCFLISEVKFNIDPVCPSVCWSFGRSVGWFPGRTGSLTLPLSSVLEHLLTIFFLCLNSFNAIMYD